MKRTKRNVENSKVLKGLIKNNLLINSLWLLIGLVITRQTSWALGVLWGTLVSAVLLWHMNRSINRTVDKPEKAAANYAVKMAMIRSVIQLVALGLAFILPILHPVAVFLSLYTTKLSSYLMAYFLKSKKSD